MTNQGKPKYPVTITRCRQLTKSERLELNGLSFGRNDHDKHAHEFCHGITSPEREFDIAWNKYQQEMVICHVEMVTPEFLAKLPEVPPDHPYNKDRQAFLASRLPSKEEWDKMDEDY